ncbi:MAG: GNAT family N-acetyltransferase [bacterium]|nr:GNAT family N-acetyltransferase [bacterium]
MRKEMRLVVPSRQYMESYLNAVARLEREFNIAKEDPSTSNGYKLARENFAAFLDKLENERHGINLGEGRVEQSVFWAIVDGSYVGRISLRHRLNESLQKIGGHIGYSVVPWERRRGYGKKMLALVLPRAKELGLTKVLITCDEDNIASKKIIEANGGILENAVLQGDNIARKLRYWINL